jgi:hypothetical protein
MAGRMPAILMYALGKRSTSRSTRSAPGWASSPAFFDFRQEQKALAAVDHETLSHKRDLVWTGLERLVQSLWPRRSDPYTAAVITKICERQARLAGLDAPALVAAKVQLSTDEQWRPMAQALARMTTSDLVKLLEISDARILGEALPAQDKADKENM